MTGSSKQQTEVTYECTKCRSVTRHLIVASSKGGIDAAECTLCREIRKRDLRRFLRGSSGTRKPRLAPDGDASPRFNFVRRLEDADRDQWCEGMSLVDPQLEVGRLDWRDEQWQIIGGGTPRPLMPVHWKTLGDGLLLGSSTAAFDVMFWTGIWRFRV